MARWLVGLILFSGAVAAEPELYLLLSQTENQPVMVVIRKLENLHLGEISGFDVEQKEGELVYDFRIINASANKILTYSYRASDGKLLAQDSYFFNRKEKSELVAVLALKSIQMTFSELVQKASKNNQGYLIKASIDNALGINYLELEFLTQEGQHQLAYNINSQRLLPLLKWD
ncbi:hypothetical protein [Shewanella surugensis]|uniref:DUF4390 domain-containing protein n=1 Tax=Shewanella surugensis TaxID=212020 RepID=A0ABT0L9N6_9GAMM|nr:hypothetical protein [Shewanella surugensis]MCL1124394.1 hypothetical protein [Shewanella surugensis]